jgi:hypothetical protein
MSECIVFPLHVTITRRVECMVPAEVYDQLVRAEAATNVYRTRVAAAVLCEWANATRSGSSQNMNPFGSTAGPTH